MKPYIQRLAIASLFLVTFCFSVKAQDNFRSIASGNWSATNVWEKDVAGNGVYATTSTVPTAANSISILVRNGHTITVTASTNADSLTVQSGGILTINFGTTFTINNGTGTDLQVASGGTLNNNGALAISASCVARVSGTLNNTGTFTGASATTLFFDAGGVYDHKFTTTAGVIPTATWNSTSTCRISGYTTNDVAPNGLNQVFGNFTWSTASLATTNGYVDLGGLPTTITGSFSVSSTGATPDALVYTTGSTATLTIAGNLNISGGSYFVPNAATGNVTINCKDFNLSGATTLFDLCDASSTGLTNLILTGDFNAPTGTIQYSAASAGGVVFKGTVTQNFTSGLTYATAVNFVIDTNAVLNLGSANFIGGSGTLTARLNSSLLVGSTVASGVLQTGTSAGQIRVGGARTFLSGSKIVFNGSGPQYIGNAVPSGAGIEINNPNGVSLNVGTTITGALILTSGNLDLATRPLTIGNSGTNTGSVSATSGRIVGTGTLNRWFGTSAVTIGTNAGLFPFGSTAGRARFVWFGGTPSSAGTVSVSYSDASGFTAIAPTFIDGSLTVDRRLNTNWTLNTGNGFAVTGASLRIQADNAPGISNVADLRITLANAAAPGTSQNGGGTNTVPLINRTGLGAVDLANTFYIGSNSASNSLPVSLLSFDVSAVKNAMNQLTWSATSITNFKHFELERSIDGEQFATIHIAVAHPKQAAEVQQFYYTDDFKTEASHTYYRLKMVDMDESVEYSKVLVVDNKALGDLVVLANNPVQQNLGITIQSTMDRNETVVVQSIDGKVVLEKSITVLKGKSTHEVNLEALSSGMYFIKFTQSGFSYKIYKNEN